MILDAMIHTWHIFVGHKENEQYVKRKTPQLPSELISCLAERQMENVSTTRKMSTLNICIVAVAVEPKHGNLELHKY